MTVFSFVCDFVTHSPRSKLSKWQEFIMVMMRLRLNMSIQDIGYRFDVSTSSVSRIFHKWIDVMYIRLAFLIRWPDREELRKTMPIEFLKNFGNRVISIIDCFEIFIDKPSGLDARCKTYSAYKNHNTCKFLISITPQGTVSFISKAWGGRASDIHITEKCGYLDKLLHGDIILADRGFPISEAAGTRGAEVLIPDFTKGKAQLSPFEVEQTRKIARVRVHVERVIGVIRQKYTILGGPLPIDFLITDQCNDTPLIDKLCLISCALYNMTDSVVPFD